MTPQQIQQFQSAILSAFPQSSSLEQAVFFGLGERLNNLVGSGALTKQVFELIEWSVAEGRALELLTALRQANPGNPALRAFESSINTAPSVDPPVTPPISVPLPVVPPPSDPPPVPQSFLPKPWFQQIPIDWTRSEPKAVRDALLAAYPRNDELIALAEDAGLAVSSLTKQSSSPKLLVREMLEKARVANRLEQLISEVFLNDEAEGVHAVLRDTLHGWEALFHAAVVRRRPSLDVLSRIAADVSLQAPDGPGSFETLLNAAADFAEPAVFRRRLAEAEARVALVHIHGTPRGTGFLVGDRYLLTNWHVVRELDGASGAGGSAVFDHKRVADGVLVQPGRAVAFANTWLLASSKPAAESVERSADGPPLTALDYALVELAEPVGAEGIGEKRDGDRRGNFGLSTEPRTFVANEPLLILGHPQARPLQLSYASPSRAAVTPSGSRVRYGTNTDAGSSGSPVMDRVFSLVALHHHGGASNNQGIPTERIAADLRARSVDAAVLKALGLQR